ncbi:hypothetical protein LWI29_007957 [Acer saccharum]|uniref:Phytochrome chromophore attachment site domain-containing protein n=1 Tax=Acer saccharum TaxID=4024 RepID=A0AA39S1Z8_ACESA|nr:hypothetical protein LWI29_007957 [Acer saccharum]
MLTAAEYSDHQCRLLPGPSQIQQASHTKSPDHTLCRAKKLVATNVRYEHGEVVAECHKPDLEPYLGLNFPATDIPQASGFLIIKNKVRMICDCLAPPVKVIQDKKLDQPLSLCGSIASLVMSVTINEEDDVQDKDQQKGRKIVVLGGLPSHKPEINKEVELAAQLREKHIMQTQTLLCDMLLRDSPVGIVAQSPNVKDLVKCDGAALYYGKKLWLLGVTPTEAQIKDIADWLLECHSASTGLSTDSLVEAGYPDASLLGDAVCGMAAVRITSKDFLFGFGLTQQNRSSGVEQNMTR